LKPPRRRRAGALCAGAAAAIAIAAPVEASADEQRLERALARAAAPATQLHPARELTAPRGGEVRRYRQRAGDLPVFDAELVVASPAGGPAIVVADDTVEALEAPSTAGAMSRAEAIAQARVIAPAERTRARIGARLGVDARSERLAWEVVIPSAQPLADYLVVLDARTGERLRPTRDLLFNAEGPAALFDPNPVVSQGGYTDLRDRRDRNSGALAAQLIGVTLPRITSTRGCLTGVYADARIGKRARRVCRPNLDFSAINRSDAIFEAVMSYFHVDRTRAYVDSLGLSRGLRRKPQKIRANAITDDNSFYSSKTRSMTLGTGGVDDGEDADVIVHEYGHSLQDQATPGFGRSIAAGSMGEGFGDYLAAAGSALRTGGSPFDFCIFDWDAVSYSQSGCGRRADRKLTIKQANRRCFREIHCTGEVWASSLFELRNELGADSAGRSIVDRVVLESHFMLTPRAGFKDGARALLAADQLLYGGAHRPAIEAEMVERAYCKRSGC
jgi:hypothetical protein